MHFNKFAVHQRQTFECCVCNKLFIRRHGFLVHIKKYHEDVTGKSFPCPFCEHVSLLLTTIVQIQRKMIILCKFELFPPFFLDIYNFHSSK